MITAFEPFGGEQINPSWEAVRQLHERMLCGFQVVAKELPCAFGDALTTLYAEMEAQQPELVIAVGQAGGRTDITVERIGININDARIADNNGNQPIDEPIIPGGPAARRLIFLHCRLRRLSKEFVKQAFPHRCRKPQEPTSVTM
ncbi:hypothetical protein GCM10007905_27620 [Mixta theicola]|nr:hypothetical protein [Mixta theicola]GLR10042.1 hypothetical protein GCM10007905_27620 [Mixta theicola]